MPMPPEHYPPGWNAFSRQIRYARAKGRCECTGQCGMHRPNPGNRRCVEQNHKPARWARGTIRLTVAHLCQCDPICLNPQHVIAACQRCHLRIDRFRHARHRLANQRESRSSLGHSESSPPLSPQAPAPTHRSWLGARKRSRGEIGILSDALLPLTSQ